MSKKPYSYLVGIDEAGRGPLAGPVSVGVVCVPTDFNWKQILGVNDSKKLTEKKREVVFEITKKLKKEGKLNFVVVMVSAEEIDNIGIVPAVNKAMSKALQRLLLLPEKCEVRLDGSLKAPAEYKKQKTIIGGDGKEKVIGLASIMAKVTRDRYMVRISAKPEYAPYALESHKGYGTLKHRESIRQHGLSDIHRKSFCTKLPKV